MVDHVSMSSLMILAVSVFQISCGKTDRQTNQTNEQGRQWRILTVMISLLPHLWWNNVVCYPHMPILRPPADVRLLGSKVPQNGRFPAQDAKEPPCKIWRRLLYPCRRNPYHTNKQTNKHVNASYPRDCCWRASVQIFNFFPKGVFDYRIRIWIHIECTFSLNLKRDSMWLQMRIL